jgi:hypothetical protein
MFKITDKHLKEVINLSEELDDRIIRTLNELYQYDATFHKQMNKGNIELLNKTSLKIKILNS